MIDRFTNLLVRLSCAVVVLGANSLWAGSPIEDLIQSSCLDCPDTQNDTGFALSDIPLEL